MAEKDIGYQWLQVSVAGVPYRWAIDPEQYVERDILDFAPRTGGGDVAYANLDLYQIWTQDSWHHGLGFIQSRDKFGYRITASDATNEGVVDTRHIGMAMLFTEGIGEQYDISADFRVVDGTDFKGVTYAIVGQTLIYLQLGRDGTGESKLNIGTIVFNLFQLCKCFDDACKHYSFNSEVMSDSVRSL